MQILDVLADPDYELHRARELGGFRTMCGVPMLTGEKVVGVIVLWRETVEAFDDRTVELVTTFAAQGAIAIQNAQLLLALQRRERELEVASRHKSEFLASMSHELRTPLNAVIGFSDVLLERMFGELGERQEEYVRDIRDSGRHLLELINEILDLSKVEAGRMELEVAPVSLPDLMAHGMAMVRERATRHRIAMSLDVATDVGTVWADELKLKQVVLNLLSNAVKFTPGRRLGGGRRRDRWTARPASRCETPASGSPRPSRSGSSRRSSAAAARPAPRAPASGSRCRAGSSSCTAAACG